jgi:hypothetical protein
VRKAWKKVAAARPALSPCANWNAVADPLTPPSLDKLVKMLLVFVKARNKSY